MSHGSESTELVVQSETQQLAVLRIENETMFSAAEARPRPPKVIRDKMLANLAAYPSAATAWVYAKPVGKERGSNTQKIVRGLSVRCAEELATVVGWNRIDTAVKPLDDGNAEVTAVFTDFANGRIWRASSVVSRKYKTFDGRIVAHNDDRFYNVVCKAELSKNVRECILRCMPAGLRAEILEASEKALASLLGNQKVSEIAGGFARHQIAVSDLENVLGKKSADWTTSDRVTLRQLYTGLEDGEIKREEILEARRENDREADQRDTARAAPAGDTAAALEAATRAAETAPAAPAADSGVGSGPETAAPAAEPAQTPRAASNASGQAGAADKPAPRRGRPPSRAGILARVAACATVEAVDELHDQLAPTMEDPGWFDDACNQRVTELSEPIG